MIKQRTNSDLLFIHRIFYGIAGAAIEIFIPLIIYNQTGNLKYAFAFAAIKCVVIAFLFLFLKKFIRKNAILSVLISIIPLIIAEFLLNIKLKLYLIIILGILAAVSETLYYGAINLIFAVMDKSANSAKFDIGYNLGQIIFTMLSAYVLGSIKNSLIFVVIFATIMHIICIIPLLKNYRELNTIIKQIPHNNQKEIIKDIKYYNFYHYFFGLSYIIMQVVLPLYLAVKGLSFTAVGILLAAGQIVKIISSMFAKFMQSKNKDVLCIIINCTLFFVSFLAIIFLKDSLAIYIFNLCVSFSCQAMQTIVFVKYVKSQVKNNYIYDSIYYRDFFQNTGRATTVSVYLILSFFPVLFGIGIVSSISTGIFGALAVKNTNKKEIANRNK